MDDLYAMFKQIKFLMSINSTKTAFFFIKSLLEEYPEKVFSYFLDPSYIILIKKKYFMDPYFLE